MHNGSKTCLANSKITSCLSEAEFLFSFQIWRCLNIIFSSLTEQRNFGCIETFSLKLCCAFFLFLFPGGPVFLLILHLCNFRHRCQDFKREIKNYKRLQLYIRKVSPKNVFGFSPTSVTPSTHPLHLGVKKVSFR